MKNIVVATDFSPVALNAVHYALKLSIAYGGDLIIVNTYQLPISYTEVPLITVSLEEIKKISEDGLMELKQNLEKISGKKIKITTISKLGDIAEVMKEI
jgi:nucleotide-binding universal stress UspA family protein